MKNTHTSRLMQYIDDNFERFISELSEHSRIPSIAFPGFPQEPLEKSAQWLVQRLQKAGLENIEILRIPDTPPAVYAEYIKSPGKPTVLLYAHHDVQPIGREKVWQSPPFAPEIRAGRLYGRGVVDDKAGAMLHIAALEAYLQVLQNLPLNIKFIIEGEEEIGSPNLTRFLEKYASQLKSDIMVLTDTANFDVGIPAITYKLRGIVDAILEVQCLDHPLHSGMWGGPIPDALTCLSKVVSRLHDDAGRVAIPNLPRTQTPEKSALPWNEVKFREQSGMRPGLQFIGEKHSVFEAIWSDYSLTCLGIDAPAVNSATNQLPDIARAKISLRVPPQADPAQALQALCSFLEKDPPFGAQVKAIPGACGQGWHQEPKGPAYAAAQRALEQGYGTPPQLIGCGGSIPFVNPLTEQFGDIPALLIGLEDPYCNAHGENESLHLADWKKGIRSALYLYAELAELSESSS